MELIRATKRKNGLSDSRHCQCGREGERLEPHCRTGIQKVCASFLHSRSRTLPQGPRGSPRPLLGKQSVNPVAPAAWAGGEGGVGVAVPAQLSPDRRAGAFPRRVPLFTKRGGAAPLRGWTTVGAAEQLRSWGCSCEPHVSGGGVRRRHSSPEGRGPRKGP